MILSLPPWVTDQGEDENEEIIKNKEKSFKEKDVVGVKSNIVDNNEENYSFKVKKDVFENAMEKGT